MPSDLAGGRTATSRPMLRRIALVLCAAFAALLMTAGPAAAHPPGATALVLDVRPDGVTGAVYLPSDQLELAWRPGDAPLAAYLAERMTVQGPDGAWQESFGAPAETVVNAEPALKVPFRLRPPGDAGTGELTVAADIILREVLTHDVHLYIGGTGGELDESQLRLAGTFNYHTGSLDVSGEESGFRATVAAGTAHVLEGFDHLLFLAMLLLPAPLIARSLKVVTAFTVGHSLSLAAVTLGGWQFNAQWVEVVIALSVAASAAHAWRPRIRGGEVPLAAGFGLVHGMAFAGLLRDLGGEPDPLTLLAFNLGVELAQLLVVALVLPSLLVLSRGPRYERIRQAAAAAGMVFALSWAVERATGWGNPLRPVLDFLTAHPVTVAVALGALAATDLFRRNISWRTP
ncbi:HupE/UreJ family protein [Actinomadura welshii]